ncbi:hypothetical protein ABT336_24425 [Micromonospora sp. NPDC000207]|uniref:hypothetical protein n=1 Tax=Micromonospora sp. NPDC000207 TaxID=3154246 RepID=UPI00331C2AE4
MARQLWDHWLRRLPDPQILRGGRDIRFTCGKTALHHDYDRLRHTLPASGIDQDAGGTDVGVPPWLAGPKRTLLSSFVVGTIGQLLFAALRSQHLVLRHLGLAEKVVVIDEAHAYDVYMNRILDRTLEWLGAHGVPVVVLSATLPARRRAELLKAYDDGRHGPPPPLTWRDRGEVRTDPSARLRTDLRYPLVTVSAPDWGATAVSCADSGCGLKVSLRRFPDDLPALADLLRDRLTDGGCALVVRNTVARVQDTAAALRAALGPDTPVSVAHSRFMALDSAAKDRRLCDTFGPPGSGTRPHRHVVVARQVADQSLDIDFDLLVADLTPVDLALQRIGRLHRHPRDRPTRLTTANCWITGADWSTEPPQPVTGSRRVYQPATLLRSAAVFLPHLDGAPLRLPTDIAPITQTAYGEAPVGPPAWQPAINQAEAKQQDDITAREPEADDFRLSGVADPPEVLPLVRTSIGLVIPPWIDGGGIIVCLNVVPTWDLARSLVQCTVALPQAVTFGDVFGEVMAELKGRLYFRVWYGSCWLAGLVLDIDGKGHGRDCPFDLYYEPQEGLRFVRND